MRLNSTPELSAARKHFHRTPNYSGDQKGSCINRGGTFSAQFFSLWNFSKNRACLLSPPSPSPSGAPPTLISRRVPGDGGDAETITLRVCVFALGKSLSSTSFAALFAFFFV